MSVRHPIISVTGSSGAGTTKVTRTFQQIFWRENVRGAFVEGDSFHRYARAEMERQIEAAERDGRPGTLALRPGRQRFRGIEKLFREYAETGSSRFRHYIHNEVEAAELGGEIGTFTDWRDLQPDTDILLYEGLHGAVKTDNVGRHPLPRPDHRRRADHQPRVDPEAHARHATAWLLTRSRH